MLFFYKQTLRDVRLVRQFGGTPLLVYPLETALAYVPVALSVHNDNFRRNAHKTVHSAPSSKLGGFSTLSALGHSLLFLFFLLSGDLIFSSICCFLSFPVISSLCLSPCVSFSLTLLMWFPAHAPTRKHYRRRVQWSTKENKVLPRSKDKTERSAES